MKIVIWSCPVHGDLNESTAWVDEKGRVICGKCGQPAKTTGTGICNTESILRTK